jgi:hypothetical protein
VLLLLLPFPIAPNGPTTIASILGDICPMAGGVAVILTGEEINASSLTVARGELVIGEVDTVIIMMSLAFDSSDDAADEEVNVGDVPVIERERE